MDQGGSCRSRQNQNRDNPGASISFNHQFYSAPYASVLQFVADAKAHYKRLAGGVEFIDVIPKNSSGKLLRWFLRDKVKELKRTPQPPIKPK